MRLDTEQLKEARRGYDRTYNAGMFAIGRDTGTLLSKDGGVFERGGRALQPQKVAIIVGHCYAPGLWIVYRFAHHDESVGITEVEGSEQNRIDHTEY